MCLSTLEFTKLNNVKSTSSIPTLLTWTTSSNIKTASSFSMSIFITLRNSETTLWIWLFEKKLINKPWVKNKITSLSFQVISFKIEYAELKTSLTLFPNWWRIYRRIACNFTKRNTPPWPFSRFLNYIASHLKNCKNY